MSKSKIVLVAAAGCILLFTICLWPKKTVPVQHNLLEEMVISEEPSEEVVVAPISDDSQLPLDVDRMGQLFNPHPPLLPIVETVSYTGRVPWLTGRAAYLGDWASHYKTSKHFISRSLHGMGNYLSDIVSTGDRFNVLRTDKEIEFHLLLDLSRLKIWVYYLDKGDNQRVLLKSYPVCAGRLNAERTSGSLTPLGTFSLGSEIAVYKPGSVGTFQNQLKEMITIFGVRWIPLDREIALCTAACKGLGIHGIPWRHDPQTGELVEYRDCIGHYESNGCIRLKTEDIKELFALIVSRPAFIHIVNDFSDGTLPGEETALVEK